jgi:hypothetical protein
MIRHSQSKLHSEIISYAYLLRHYHTPSVFNSLWLASAIVSIHRQLKFDDLWNVGAPIGDSSDEIAFKKAKEYWIAQGAWNDKYHNPFCHFVYQQIPRERKRIEDEEGTATSDINTRAYKNVKSAWVSRCIWHHKWDILPGMMWKHEEPRVEESIQSAASMPAKPPRNGSHEPGDAPIQTNLGLTSPIGANDRQESGDTKPSQSYLPGLVTRQAERPSPALNSHPVGNGKQVPSLSMTLRPRPSRTTPSHKDSQLPSLPSVPQGLVHPSTVSKNLGRKRPDHKRQSQVSGKTSLI